jgi:hypothetical protein
MGRDRIIFIIALPVIAAAGFLLWKEYAEYYGKPPVPELTDAAKVTLPTSLLGKTDNSATSGSTTATTDKGIAVEEKPKRLSAEDEDTIGRAKSTPASTLDSALPDQPVGDWIAHTAGASARLRWEANRCDSQEKSAETSPICAQTRVEFPDGTTFQAMLLMGSQPMKPVGPAQYSEPSLLWAVYGKSGGSLTPGPFGSLRRIAKQHSEELSR